MKKGDFLWSAYRITEKQKAGKARNIKEKQLKNSRSTVSKPPVAHPSSPSAEPYSLRFQEPLLRWRLLFLHICLGFLCMLGQKAAVRRKISYSNRDGRERSAQ